MKKSTNKELQTEIERRFSESLRDLPQFAGLRPHVSIRYKKNGRKLREDVSAKDYWPADTNEISVSFEPDAGLPHPSLAEVQAILGPSEDAIHDFQPVAIRGEALSNTVLRERR